VHQSCISRSEYSETSESCRHGLRRVFGENTELDEVILRLRMLFAPWKDVLAHMLHHRPLTGHMEAGQSMASMKSSSLIGLVFIMARFIVLLGSLQA
jgi:hypothetical protein